MQELAEKQMLEVIGSGEPFSAAIEGGGFEVKVDEYCPYIGTAIHAGHGMREELLANCLLDDDQRRLEEDPFTDQFVQDFPITLVGRDSRYEYDLNRGPETAIYETAWGIDVWRTPLTPEQRQTSLDKHTQYYRIMRALASQVEKRFGGALLIDTHSYNYRVRDHATPPVFNIGTEQVDEERWRSVLQELDRQLPAIELTDIDTTLGWNAVFYGRGYQATVARKYLQQTLVVPLEVKKVFMDERSGEAFPQIIDCLRRGFNQSIASTVEIFVRDHC